VKADVDNSESVREETSKGGECFEKINCCVGATDIFLDCKCFVEW